MIPKLGIITTHPIQYNSPLFSLLSERGRVKVKVFFTWGETVLKNKFDPGFGKTIQWDIPLLEGFEYVFIKNGSKHPGSDHFNGIDNPTLIREIEDWSPDAILIYGWAFKSHLKALRFFNNKIPVLFRGDSLPATTNHAIKTLARRIFLRWVYSHVDHALYVGTLNKQYFLEAGLKPRQLSFAPHSIDNRRFLEDEANRQYKAGLKRKELGIAEEDIVLLYAGKLDDNKNVSFVLNIFSRLKLPGVHFIVAGNGINEATLKKDFLSIPSIHFLPFQNQQDMPTIYRMAEIFVLPSLSETWGLGINEAMICGCAVLVTNRAGAAPDLVKDGLNGYQFHPTDANELQNKLLSLLADKVKLKKMGAHSKQIIHNWNYEKCCDTIEQLMWEEVNA